MAPLHLHLLGSPRIIRENQTLTLPSRKAWLLLAYLLVERRPCAREQLAGLFWPDSEPEVARSALRNLLSQLRKVLEDRLEVQGNLVGLQLQPGDTHDLQEAHLPAGPLLHGLEVPEEGLLQDWLQHTRHTAQARQSLLLAERTRQAFQAGRWPEAVQWAKQRFYLDPGDPDACVLLMQVQASAASLMEAEHAFEMHRQHLHLLGLQVSQQVQDALQTYKMKPAASPGQSGQVALSGRQRELETLHLQFQQVRVQQGQAVMVLGEPGIGKSRLSEEAVQRFEKLGAWVLRARAQEGDAILPDALSVDLLRNLVQGDLEPLREMLPEHLRTLQVLWPQLSSHMGLKSPGATGEPLNRSRLRDALLDLLQQASDRPVVVFFDDLQWADQSSLGVWEFVLSRAVHSQRILVLTTVRTENLSQVTPWWSRIGRFMHPRRMVLQVLAEGDLQGWAAVLHGPDRDRVLRFLFSHTQGHPLYLKELLQDLIDQGLLEVQGQHLQLTPLGQNQLETTRSSGVEHAIEGRLCRLGGCALQLFQCSVVLGQPEGFDTLLQLSRLGEDEALDALDELLQAGLLVEQGGRYLCSHDRVRSFTLEHVPPERRKRLHRRVLEVLPDHPPAFLGKHAALAQMGEVALSHWQEAAQVARQVGALSELAAALQAQLEWTTEPSARAEVLLQCAEALDPLDRVDEQQAAGSEALHLARQLQDVPLTVRALLRLAWVLQHHDLLESRRVAEEALDLARSTPDGLLVASSLQALARTYRHEDPDHGLKMQEEALVLLRAAGDPRRLAYGCINLAYALRAAGHWDRMRSALEEVLHQTELAPEDGGLLVLRASAQHVLGIEFRQRNDVQTARQHFEQSLQLQERLKVGAPMATQVELAVLQAAEGDTDLAEKAVLDWIRQDHLQWEPSSRRYALVLLAEVRHHQGRNTEAARLLGTVQNAGAVGPQYWRVNQLLQWVRARLPAGQFQEALQHGQGLTVDHVLVQSLGG
ncbi:ATP-binding protein [Deinococcus roseus]|uniref:Transcriptional activator n=1 Tax=Deinococcus roseus TaxID=392414 RepID=A0ABQ2D496_9DEIO|nr:AAA family ATPase [Deinococcus roseus]GGJ43668.1 transcriptional activator [Deinococcus roseus]